MIRFATAALALALLPIAAPQAQAQSSLCVNRVVIESVYRTGLPGNRFEYFVYVRNHTNRLTTLRLDFTGFDSTVTLYNLSQSNIHLLPYATQFIRFGEGTNGNINNGTVTKAYDTRPAAGRPSVTAVNCR